MAAVLGRMLGWAPKVATTGGDDAIKMAKAADDVNGNSLMKLHAGRTVDGGDFSTAGRIGVRNADDIVEETLEAAAKRTDDLAKAAAEEAKKLKDEAAEAARIAEKAKADAEAEDLIGVKTKAEKEELFKRADELEKAAKDLATKADEAAEVATNAKKAAAKAADDVPGPRSGGKKLTPEKIEEAKVEFKEMGFNDAQVEKIMNSGIDLEELKKMHKMGMPIVPKTLWQEMKSTANIVNMVGAGGATYLATKWAEGGDQEEAAANSSESSYKGADPLGYNPYYGI